MKLILKMILFSITLISSLTIIITKENNITQLKIGSKAQRREFRNQITQLYMIKTNYKPLSIQLWDFTNINFIQITDRINTTSLNQSSYTCASNVSLCQSNNREVNSNSTILIENKLYVNSLYLILKPIDLSLISRFEANIDFLINDQNEESQNIYETPFAFCGESNLEDCRNCGRPSCTLIQCGYEEVNEEQEEKFHILNEVCLPYSIDDNQIKGICRNFYLASTYRPSGNCDYGDSAGYSYVKMIVFSVIIIAVIICSLIVLYYQVYVSIVLNI